MSVLTDKHAEAAVFTAALALPKTLRSVIEEVGLRPEHFHADRARLGFEAVLSLYERQVTVDPITLRAELDRLGDHDAAGFVDLIIAQPLDANNAKAYATRVRDLCEWRTRKMAAVEMIDAADALNHEGWANAVGLLDVDTSNDHRSHTATSWGELLLHGLERTDNDAIALPFAKLSEALDGGLRPGEFVIAAGYTSHGKSVFVDQVLDDAASQGKRVHLYMTEMTAYSRGLRLLARRTGVEFKALKRRELEKEWPKIIAAVQSLPYGCTVTADWTVDDVARDIRRAKWDLAVVDLIHGFHYADERDLDRICLRLVAAAKAGPSHDGTAILAAAHLNDAQMRDSKSNIRPKPGMHSLKGASSIKQHADTVMFVWQQDDDDGLPTGDGAIWIAKSRQGAFAGVAVHLNHRAMRFELAG